MKIIFNDEEEKNPSSYKKKRPRAVFFVFYLHMSKKISTFAAVFLIKHMLITELKELQKILYFEGDYALFRAVDELGMYRGVINRKGDKGQWVIPPIYDSIHWRRDYYVAYVKEPRRIRKAGLLDRTGKVLVPFEYTFLDPAYTEDLISVKKRGKCFFINSKNEKIKLF